jgi:hypothetical protein
MLYPPLNVQEGLVDTVWEPTKPENCSVHPLKYNISSCAPLHFLLSLSSCFNTRYVNSDSRLSRMGIWGRDRFSGTVELCRFLILAVWISFMWLRYLRLSSASLAPSYCFTKTLVHVGGIVATARSTAAFGVIKWNGGFKQRSCYFPRVWELQTGVDLYRYSCCLSLCCRIVHLVMLIQKFRFFFNKQTLNYS